MQGLAVLIEPEITAPPKPPAQRSAQPLTPQDPLILLGFRCMQRELDTLVARGPRGATAPGVDDVHQMRIALRRLRVALRLFGHMLPNQEATELKHELRWLARGLGAVRDLDVHTAEFRDHVRGTSPQCASELGEYELDLRRQRATARTELRALLASDRYRALLATLERLVGAGPSPAALRRFKSFSIREGAIAHLRRSRKRVLALGRKLDAEASADDLHRLRIRAKRLRYELEFFREPYAALGTPIAAVKELQDVLGADRDALLGAARLKEYRHKVRGRRRDGAVPVAALDAWAAQQAEAGDIARRQLPATWRRLTIALKKSAFKAL
jgi:CHAD domain-containing protein